MRDGEPSGTLSFYSDGQLIGTEALSGGSADSFYVPPAQVLNKSVIVTYSGDGNFLPAQTAPMVITNSLLQGPRGSFQSFFS